METTGMVVDTSIFIDHLRSKNKSTTALSQMPIENGVYISPVTLYELYMGATSLQKWNDVDKITKDLLLLDFSHDVAKKSARIFQDLKKKNNVIEFRDIFIGATALCHNLSVFTLNKRDFSRIKGLRVITPNDLNF